METHHTHVADWMCIPGKGNPDGHIQNHGVFHSVTVAKGPIIIIPIIAASLILMMTVAPLVYITVTTVLAMVIMAAKRRIAPLVCITVIMVLATVSMAIKR